MQQRGAGPDGSPLVSQLAMHLMAILAVAMVGLGLAFMSLGGLGTASHRSGAADGSAPPADGVAEKATPIESLPYRDDAVEPAAAGTAPDEPRSSCLTPSHTAWYTLVPESDLPLSAWVVPDADEAAALDVGVAIFAAAGGRLAAGVRLRRRPRRWWPGAARADGPPGAGVLHRRERRRPTRARGGQPDVPRAAAAAGARPLRLRAQRSARRPSEDVDVDAVGARTEPGEITPSCADTDATTWYAISSPQDAVLSATVSPAAGAEDALDVAIALHTGDAVDALTEVACSDASGVDGAEHLEVPIFGGEDYWLQVGAVLSQDAGPGVYTLSIDGIQTIDLRPLPDTVLGADPVAISAEASSGLPVAIEVAGPCRVADGMLVADGAGSLHRHRLPAGRRRLGSRGSGRDDAPRRSWSPDGRPPTGRGSERRRAHRRQRRGRLRAARPHRSRWRLSSRRWCAAGRAGRTLHRHGQRSPATTIGRRPRRSAPRSRWNAAGKPSSWRRWTRRRSIPA